MKFEKGNPKPANTGRKKGVKNKKNLVKVSDYLKENELHPVYQIMELIPSLLPNEQIKCWMDLLSYCEAKPKYASEVSTINARFNFEHMTDEELDAEIERLDTKRREMD